MLKDRVLSERFNMRNSQITNVYCCSEFQYMNPEAFWGMPSQKLIWKKTRCIAVHFLFCVDINECKNSSTCYPLANCSNTEGSFSCQCKMGYTGDGIVNCTGNIKHFKKFFVSGNCEENKRNKGILNFINCLIILKRFWLRCIYKYPNSSRFQKFSLRFPFFN